MISEVKVNKYVYDNYKEPVTILADSKHIFTYANLTLIFYQRPGKVTIYHTKTRAEWPACATRVCLYSRLTKTPDPLVGARLVYTTRPFWADELGFKDLMDGMKWWTVWELRELRPLETVAESVSRSKTIIFVTTLINYERQRV